MEEESEDNSNKLNSTTENVDSSIEVEAEEDGEETRSMTSLSDEEDDDEDEDEEDEEPPRLKYTRITNLPHSFLNKDAISCCLFDSSVIVFATHSGFVHLMTPDLTPIRTFRAHRASVLSIHTDGEHIATGSMDGTVVIGSIADPNDIFAVDFKRPIHAVALEGRYSVSKSFITGGTSGKVLLSTKNWLGQRVDSVLEDTDSIILDLQIFGDLVVWMNDNGLNFYQLSSRTKLYSISLPQGFPRPDLYWPKTEVSGNQMLIGWANNVWSIKLIESTSDSRSIISTRSSLEKKIHIEKHIQFKDTLIAGISRFNDDFLLLTYSLPNAGKSQPPELKIVSGITLEDLSLDEVEMKNYSSLGLNDYKLKKFGNAKWVLVGANDVIIVEEFNLSDRLSWYLERSEYMEAWKISANLIPEYQRYDEIAFKLLTKFTVAEDWDSASEFLCEVTNNVEDPDLLKMIWQFWISKFQESLRFDEIVDKIPLNLALDSKIYNNFLNHYLDLKSPKLIQLTQKWDHSLFDISGLNFRISEILNDYDQGDKEELSTEFIHQLRLLHIDLLVESHDYIHAAEHYFKIRYPQILQFLSENHLLRELFERIPELMTTGLSKDELKFSSTKNLEKNLLDKVKILIDNRHEIPPSDVVNLMKLHELDVVNFFYLRMLFETSGFITNIFEDEMVRLYSQFDNSQLLLFLHKYKSYSIESAIEICKENGFIKELVFLYSKIGQNKMALDLIINKLDDPHYAIEFTLSLKDTDLFEHLVNYSADKPQFIKLLIIEAGNNKVDVKKVITRVPSGVEIENLQKTLIDISSDNNSETLIYSQVLKIIQDETMILVNSLRNMSLKGDVLDPSHQKEILDGETIIKFPGNPKLYKERELVSDAGLWKHLSSSISDKIRHFIYIKNRKTI